MFQKYCLGYYQKNDLNQFYVQIVFAVFFFFAFTQMDTPVSRTKVAVRRRSPRAPKSFLCNGVSSVHVWRRRASYSGQSCSRCSVVMLPVWHGHWSDWPIRNYLHECKCVALSLCANGPVHPSSALVFLSEFSTLVGGLPPKAVEHLLPGFYFPGWSSL